MDKEEILRYFKDENSPVGLFRYCWHGARDFNTTKITNNFIHYDDNNRRNVSWSVCSYDIGSRIVVADRFWTGDLKDYPREAVIYGDVAEVKETPTKTKDILTNGNDEEAGFLAYIHDAIFDYDRKNEAIYTFIAPSEKIDTFASHIKHDPRLVHQALSNIKIEPCWIKGIKKINGKMFISPYQEWEKHLKMFRRDFWNTREELHQDLFVKCITEGTQTYELEEEFK
ncbi:MAG: hypothetical protein KJ906_02330 [Nanoarchaeota archaeon]|nr:hypothetical protein [Nanoarchaeota archaeon]